jgi:hypothetical protein
MSTGAVSRYIQTTEPGIYHGAEVLLRADAGVRVARLEGHDIESSMFKNRDKQMTFIVRVSEAFIIF